ncbi:MAG: hypothetical protein R3B39_01430 [Candidatus Paceibacterota bacterium]
MQNNQKMVKGKLNHRRVFFFSLILLVGIAFSLYMFFLGRTIFDLVDRKNVEQEIRLASSRISELELLVLDYNNEVTLQKAYELGFINNADPKFVSRKQTALLR